MNDYKLTKESTGATIIIEAVNLYEAQLRINRIDVEYKHVKDD